MTLPVEIDLSDPRLRDISPEEVASAIASLDKHKVAKLIKAKTELARRKEQERSRYYVPYPHQLKAHSSTKRFRMVEKSNRSGGSWWMLAEINWRATGHHPYRPTPKPPQAIRLHCIDFTNGIEKLWIPLMRSWVKREDLLGGSWDRAFSKETMTLYYDKKYGSFTEFMSYSQEAEKYAGVERDFNAYSEPARDDIFQESQSRLVSCRDSETIMEFTPTPDSLNDKTMWLYDLYLEILAGLRPEWDLFHFNWRDNQSLTKEEIDNWISQMKEEDKASRLEGKFPQMAGLVYKNFNRARHVIKPFPITNDYSVYIAFDLHPDKPSNVGFYAIDRNENHYIWDELEIAGSALEIVAAVRAKLGKRDLVMGYVEKFAKTGNQILDAERDMQMAILDPMDDGSNRGIFTTDVGADPGSVRVGIDLITEMLGYDETVHKSKLFVFDTCPGHIHQFETYMWNPRISGSAKPIKRADDYMDCDRIYFKGNPCYMKTRKVILPQDETEYDPVLGGIA